MVKWLGGVALVVVVTGVLPLSQARGVLVRVDSILVFLAAVTVVAELADAAGVFEAAAGWAARLAGGRVAVLFASCAVLATVTTVFLSLDTTAVLLTPIVVTLAQRVGISAIPFAMMSLWLANTASLLLPVSNLTNLLSIAVVPPGHSYVHLSAVPAAGVLVVSLTIVWLRYRPALRGNYDIPPPEPVDDRPLLAVSAAGCVLMAAAFALGAPPAWAATAVALVLILSFAVRRPVELRPTLVPWRLLVTTVSIFVLVQAALRSGVRAGLSAAAGTGDSFVALLQFAATAAGASNLVNNLPAYLALEPEIGTGPADERAHRLMALLVGTNAGPLLLPWGSLATLLWLDRCRARGVVVPVRERFVLAAVSVPLMLVVAAGLLASGASDIL